ncbi:MAG TPA: ABC transporter ATP-binding protein, partial [Patescibacteria group bacterium]|nr:ABC transporter ATP-binding protein [Patescibacteria group bacterium]
ASTEAAFWQSFKKGLPGTTCIVVTHRLATAMQADRILVLDSGRIAEEGTHATLLKSGKLYRKFMVKGHEPVGEKAGF